MKKDADKGREFGRLTRSGKAAVEHPGGKRGGGRSKRKSMRR
jgi:hypothetical protein